MEYFGSVGPRGYDRVDIEEARPASPRVTPSAPLGQDGTVVAAMHANDWDATTRSAQHRHPTPPRHLPSEGRFRVVERPIRGRRVLARGAVGRVGRGSAPFALTSAPPSPAVTLRDPPDSSPVCRRDRRGRHDPATVDPPNRPEGAPWVRIVDFTTVSDRRAGTSPSPMRSRGCGPAGRYFQNKSTTTLHRHPADVDPQTVGWVTGILRRARHRDRRSPLRVAICDVDGIHWVHVFYGSGLAVNVLWTVGRAGNAPVGFQALDGIVPEELGAPSGSPAEVQARAGTIRGSYFVIKGRLLTGATPPNTPATPPRHPTDSLAVVWCIDEWDLRGHDGDRGRLVIPPNSASAAACPPTRRSSFSRDLGRAVVSPGRKSVTGSNGISRLNLVADLLAEPRRAADLRRMRRPVNVVLDASAVWRSSAASPGPKSSKQSSESGATCGAANWSRGGPEGPGVRAGLGLVRALLVSYGIRLDPIVAEDAEWAARRWRRDEGLAGRSTRLALGSRLGVPNCSRPDAGWDAATPIPRFADRARQPASARSMATAIAHGRNDHQAAVSPAVRHASRSRSSVVAREARRDSASQR